MDCPSVDRPFAYGKGRPPPSTIDVDVFAPAPVFLSSIGEPERYVQVVEKLTHCPPSGLDVDRGGRVRKTRMGLKQDASSE